MDDLDRLAGLAKAQRALFVVAALAMSLALVMVFGYAPTLTDRKCPLVEDCWSAPVAQKLFYFHVPVAWAAFLSFLVVFLASAVHLAERDARTRFWSDVWALSAAEVGVVLTTLTLLSGMIWGEAEWGVAWRWTDTKLVLVFLLWLTYLGYLVLRANVPAEAKRQKLAAVFGVLGFVLVPLSWVAQRIWRSVHPTVVASPEGGGLETAGIRNTFLVATLAFTLLAAWLLAARVRLEAASRLAERMETEGP